MRMENPSLRYVTMFPDIIHVGSAASVDLGRYPHRPIRKNLDFNDPINVKNALCVGELNQKLFPVVSTGATMWPYLFVARDLQQVRDQGKVRASLRRIYRRMRDTTVTNSRR